MANTNAITAIYSLPTQTINATAETVLTQTVNGVTSNAVLAMPANANVDSHSFIVRLIGKATGGTGATLQLAFYLGSTSGTKIATFTVSGAAIPVSGGNFSVTAVLTWDSVSGLLNGYISGQTNNTLVVVGTGGGAYTQATGITSAAGLQFVATAKFGAALATNTVTAEEFTIEAV